MIREFRPRRRIDHRRAVRPATLAAVALLAASCGDSGDSAGPADDTTTMLVDVGNETTTTAAEPTATTAPVTSPTTVVPLTLEEQIAANLQGAQSEYLDIWGDGEPALVFFHHGDWAAEAAQWPWTSNDHCLRSTYTWSVADATSESDFSVHYDTLTENPDCVALGITRLTAVFSGSQQVNGRTVYDFGYTDGVGTEEKPITGTRTVCSDQWNDPEPCGLTLPGFEMPTPPQG